MSPAKQESDGSGAMAAAITFSTVGVVLALSAVSARIGPAAIPIWFALFGALGFMSRGPIGKAIAARIHREPTLTDVEVVVPPELYSELDELRGRLAELEERQDFSERLLSNRNDSKEQA